MKKLFLTALLALNFSLPANAFVAAGISGAGAPFVIYMTAGSIQMMAGVITESPMHFVAATLMDGNQNSENTLAQVEIDSDIDRMVSIGIYSESEAENLKTELAEFEASGKSLTVDGTQLKDKSPEEVVSAIQSEAEVSRLTAEYIAHKIGVQIQ